MPEPKLATWLTHLGEDAKPHGAVVPPIFQNSLFVYDTYDDFIGAMSDPDTKHYGYTRAANPTTEIVEAKLAALEGTEQARLFGSGMAAISAVILAHTRAGAHVVCIDSIYGCTRGLLDDILVRFGVETTYVDGSDPEEVIAALRPNTTLVFLESPSSFVMKLQDLAAIAAVCRERGIITAVDNSYSAGILSRPCDFGIDYTVHSVTKYLAGHSDVVAGAVCGPARLMEPLVRSEGFLIGGILAPMAAWLVLRGLRTLPLRLARHQETGNAVAKWLLERDEVARVYHVGLPCFAQRELFQRQMKGSGGLLSFVPMFQGRERVVRFVESLKLFQLGVSWGGFESLVVAFPLERMGLEGKPWVVRLYCGLEEPEDLMADLDQAFAAALH